MNIGIISTVRGQSWPGSEELWYEMALVAVASGHQVTAYLHESIKSTGQVKTLTAAGVRIRLRSTFRFSRLWNLKEKMAPSFPVSELREFDRILLNLGSLLDIFYVPGLLGAIRKADVPCVPLCHFNAESLSFSASQRNQLRNFAENSAAFYFVSQHNLQLAERQLAIKLKSARVVKNPVRKILARPLPWLGEDVMRMACVARFDVLWKGQDVLLEVLSHAPWTDRSWSLSLYGDGGDMDYLKRAVKFFGLEGRVEFCGYVRDVEAIWQKQHLMVMASRGEGLPLVVLEAMMCGRPVVTTDVGGNREVLEEGVTGFIADAATPRSFGQALERAWNERSSLERMGRTAHQYAREFAPPNAGRQLLDDLLG